MAYGIDTMLMSHHEHNQQVSIPKIIERLENGENVAVVSDAGYPLVSDPGQKLVQETISHGFNVVSVSGANAAMNALVASGLSCYHYLFYGFLDNKSSKRKKQHRRNQKQFLIQLFSMKHLIVLRILYKICWKY
mgnify:CR=1 FL=1